MLERIKTEILTSSFCVMEKIGEKHSEIEKLYSTAMNFKKKEKYEKSMIKEILSLIEKS